MLSESLFSCGCVGQYDSHTICPKHEGTVLTQSKIIEFGQKHSKNKAILHYTDSAISIVSKLKDESVKFVTYNVETLDKELLRVLRQKLAPDAFVLLLFDTPIFAKKLLRIQFLLKRQIVHFVNVIKYVKALDGERAYYWPLAILSRNKLTDFVPEVMYFSSFNWMEERLAKTLTRKGDVLLDINVGRMSLFHFAHKNNRKYIGTTQSVSRYIFAQKDQPDFTLCFAGKRPEERTDNYIGAESFVEDPLESSSPRGLFQ